MTTADTPATPEAGLPTCADIPAVRNFLAKCCAGWSGDVTRSVGTIEEGKIVDHKRITTTLDVESVMLRLRHPDGRSIRIVWAREPGAKTATGRDKAYGYKVGVRAPHGPAEVAPVEISSTVAPAYVGAETLVEATEALGCGLGLGVRADPVSSPAVLEFFPPEREPVPGYQSRGWQPLGASA